MNVTDTLSSFAGENIAEFFAKNVHERNGQTYDDKPYSFHLCMAVSIAHTYGFNLFGYDDYHHVIAACWCHDLMEDCGISRETLEDVIGKRAAEIVWRVTDEPGQNRKERHEKTYPKIAADPLAIFVKLCDRLANTKYSYDTHSDLLDMYQREYPGFRAALYVLGQYDNLWAALDYLKYKGTNK